MFSDNLAPNTEACDWFKLLTATLKWFRDVQYISIFLPGDFSRIQCSLACRLVHGYQPPFFTKQLFSVSSGVIFYENYFNTLFVFHFLFRRKGVVMFLTSLLLRSNVHFRHLVVGLPAIFNFTFIYIYIY